MARRPPTHAQLRGRAQEHAEYDANRRATDAALAFADRVRHSAEWTALREWFRTHHPYCRRCEERGRPYEFASVLDHIVPIRMLYARHPDDASRLAAALDPSNLQRLCRRCDREKQEEERRGA